MNHRILLQDAFKGYTFDQDKAVSPEETVRRFREKLRTVDMDILAGTVRIDNGRLDIPVYFSLCGKDAHEIIGTKKQMGKGGTPIQSEASAVMELAERFSFFSFCREPKNFFVEEFRNLNTSAIPFEAIARSVHDDSEDLALAREIFSRLPLKWTWAYNLTRQEEVLIPFNWFYTINEFNGPCAGNCVEEALIQGICEIVERHVSSIVSRSRLRTPAVTPRSITDPLALEMVGKYAKAGIRLFLSDFSLNTGIPSVGALAYDPSTFPARSEIVWTAGTTPNPQKALSRALTEVAQLAGDFNTASNYVASGLPKFRGIEEAGFVMDPGSEISINALPDLSNENMRLEVENLLNALAQIQMDVLVVDVMHPLLRIPAFYTIIPGAHFRERAVGTGVAMFSAKLIAESNDPAWAVQELRKMESLLPGRYYTQFFLGLSHLAQGSPEQALPFFERALQLDPKEEDTVSIHSYLGLCLKDLGKYREAIRVLEEGTRYDDERTDIYNLMGFCHFKLREHEKAIQCFRKVVQLNPASAIDYANIASNYRDMGERDMAIQYYRLALDLDPTIEFARENLARLGSS